MAAMFRTHVLGPMAASVVAGPVLVTGQLIADSISEGHVSLAGSERDVFVAVIVVIGMMMVAVIVGFFTSIVPNIIGTTIMWAFGRAVRPARHPVLWALVGAAAAGGFALSDAVDSELPGRPIAYAVTGALCALICRRFARWTDEGDQ